MTIAIITDSTAQLPPMLVERYGVEIVPIPIDIDGVTYHEGVDLDADGFFALHRQGIDACSTSQPAPGSFAECYERVQSSGATEIVSIHVGAAFSGTVNSARLGAEMVEVPVHIIDSGTASFGVSACIWEAGELRDDGATTDGIRAGVEQLVPQIATSVLFEVLDHMDASGRATLERPDADGIAVYHGVGPAFHAIGTGRTPHELCALLAKPFAEATMPIRAGIARADTDTACYTDALVEMVDGFDHVLEVVEYRVGPSIAVHSGPATAGGFLWPVTARANA